VTYVASGSHVKPFQTYPGEQVWYNYRNFHFTGWEVSFLFSLK